MAQGSGRLTTHVLDTMRGRPAAGIKVALMRIEGDRAMPLANALTNADGRCDRPLLEGPALTPGVYELRFAVGGYFAVGQLEAPTFLDEVPIRFRIVDAAEHYHVPLLISPFAYSTYRGS